MGAKFYPYKLHFTKDKNKIISSIIIHCFRDLQDKFIRIPHSVNEKNYKDIILLKDNNVSSMVSIETMYLHTELRDKLRSYLIMIEL